MEGAAPEGRDVDVRLEAVDLPPVGVALDFDVEHADERLIASDDAFGQRDEAGAGAPDGDAGVGEAPDRAGEAVETEKAVERRRLAAGDDQPVEAVEVLGETHAAGLGAQLFQPRSVLGEVSLQGEYADDGHSRATAPGAITLLLPPAPPSTASIPPGTRYQPREASISSGFIDRTSMPDIASPRPIETFARMSGLS